MYNVLLHVIGAMSYGKMIEVKDKHGVPIKTSNGTSRVGRGWGYDTFRSSFHALKTVHRIFYGDVCYEVINGKAIGNPLMCAEVIVSSFNLCITHSWSYINDMHCFFNIVCLW